MLTSGIQFLSQTRLHRALRPHWKFMKFESLKYNPNELKFGMLMCFDLQNSFLKIQFPLYPPKQHLGS